jgi:hypothetical protein
VALEEADQTDVTFSALPASRLLEVEREYYLEAAKRVSRSQAFFSKRSAPF